MQWIDLASLPVSTVLPAEYTAEQLSRADIPSLIENIKAWYPDIGVGSASCFLRPEFYEREVFLRGEPETDVICYVVRTGSELVALLCIERNRDSGILYGRLGIVSPNHRRQGITKFAPFILDTQARGMGAGLIYVMASLRSAAPQILFEASSFRLVGILPSSDREVGANGQTVRVSEAIYAKVVDTPDTLLEPNEKSMTPQVQALWKLLSLAK